MCKRFNKGIPDASNVFLERFDYFWVVRRSHAEDARSPGTATTLRLLMIIIVIIARASFSFVMWEPGNSPPPIKAARKAQAGMCELRETFPLLGFEA